MNFFLKDNIFRQLAMTSCRLENYANHNFFEPLGLTTSTCKILALFMHFERLTAREIISEVGGTKANITQRLNRLEKMNLIKRCQKKNGYDKRTVEIALTDNGKSKIKEIHAFVQNRSREITKLFNKKDVLCCLQVLDKINYYLDNQVKNVPGKAAKAKEAKKFNKKK